LRTKNTEKRLKKTRRAGFESACLSGKALGTPGKALGTPTFKLAWFLEVKREGFTQKAWREAENI